MFTLKPGLILIINYLFNFNYTDHYSSNVSAERNHLWHLHQIVCPPCTSPRRCCLWFRFCSRYITQSLLLCICTIFAVCIHAHNWIWLQFVHLSPNRQLLSGSGAASTSAPKSESSSERKITLCQSISPPESNSAVSKESAVIMQDLSAEESSISQSSAGSASDNCNSNSSSEKPSSSLKSSLKSLAKMVHRTLVVKRKVQIINLNTVISSHRNWRANSEGYQNLFEFGELAF